MDKILSIIIPTYNMEKYLRKCLDSLIVSDTNMKRLEVLVINDGSKDSSSQIGHEYESRYPLTFRVIDKENGNYGSCVNRGLKEATGKYVKVLDADDSFDSGVFDQYISFLDITDVDMVLTDYNEVNTKGNVTCRRVIPYPNQKKLNIEDMCTDNAFINLQMHAVTYKRSLLIENNYTQTTGVSYTDQEWVFLPITYMNSFCHYDGFLYQYLVGREGQTIDPCVSAKQADVRFNLIFKRFDIYFKLSNNDVKKSNKNQYLRMRLIQSSSAMYKSALIEDGIPIAKIKEFDRKIKSLNKEVYDELAHCDLCKWKNQEYIYYWRLHNSLPLMVKLMKLMYMFK